MKHDNKSVYVKEVTSLGDDFIEKDKNYALKATYVLIGFSIGSALTLGVTNQLNTSAALVPLISGLGSIFYAYEAHQEQHDNSKVKRK